MLGLKTGTLPNELREITSLARFKRSVYIYLFFADNAAHMIYVVYKCKLIINQYFYSR